ncbi:hypothetical protein [Flavobacterium rivuli]|uniref:hypothetical protein n=1 Tax=Flavobacterium rivuli TaxID=498301 RepID=UPI00036EEF4F|nr:hypothetical protein [Flavobacterium rivuli]
MKLFYLLRLPTLKTIGNKKDFHTSPLHKHDQCDGCEFLDESMHMHDAPFADTELGDY